MPAHEHAWVMARRSNETVDQFRDRVDGAIRGIAASEPLIADSDTTYETLTNSDLPYGYPALPPDPRSRSLVDIELPDLLPVPKWQIDPYAAESRPRDYAAVKKVIGEFQKRISTGKLPVPEAPEGLAGDKLKDHAKEHYPLLGEMATSNLLGMGGAGEPTFDKWAQLWQAKGKGTEKYIVCNGDESEPGTFKDRELLLRMPHLIVEGIIIAGLLTKATAGYIYVRHEYFEQIHALEEEIKRAQRLGACGPDIFESGIGFRVEVFESPGGYICGEQSALIEAMEDKRGQPRQRPPELQTNGLWDQPTVVNNVETLAWAPYIMLNKGEKYASLGWRAPTPPGQVPAPCFGGRRLFSVSGDIFRPGVFEVPVGLPLGELLEDPKYCGGVVGELFAVAPSGPSSGLIPATIPLKVPGPNEYDQWIDGLIKKFRTPAEKATMSRIAQNHLPPGATGLDIRQLPLDLNFFRGLGNLRLKATPALGAAIVIYAVGTDPLDEAVNFTRFFRNESCGKCVPCRLGSQKLYQIGLELIKDRKAGKLARSKEPGQERSNPLAGVLDDVKVLTETLSQTSICGLGQVAPVPLTTALEYFGGAIMTLPPGRRPSPPGRPNSTPKAPPVPPRTGH
jgi:NADH:ubiquinone oxidoreductase subunit F (NADH-binding)